MEEFCSEKDQTYTQCLSLYVSTKYIHIIKEQKTITCIYNVVNKYEVNLFKSFLICLYCLSMCD